jgi:hypothetical protein
MANQFYKIYTWNGYDPNVDWSTTPNGKPINIQGDRSRSTFNHLDATLKYRLKKKIAISTGIDFYWRSTYYNDLQIRDGGGLVSYPKVYSKQIGAHLMLTYIL